VHYPSQKINKSIFSIQQPNNWTDFQVAFNILINIFKRLIILIFGIQKVILYIFYKKYPLNFILVNYTFFFINVHQLVNPIAKFTKHILQSDHRNNYMLTTKLQQLYYFNGYPFLE